MGLACDDSYTDKICIAQPEEWGGGGDFNFFTCKHTSVWSPPAAEPNPAQVFQVLKEGSCLLLSALPGNEAKYLPHQHEAQHRVKLMASSKQTSTTHASPLAPAVPEGPP